MEVVKNKNKQKADEVMHNNNNKNQNDEIINKNVKKKGNGGGSGSGSNKKKKNKQKHSHNNDKAAPNDDDMSKQQQITLPTTITIEEIICNDDKHQNNNGNNLLSDSQENIDDEVMSHTPSNKPFIAPLAPMTTTTTTTPTTQINENKIDVDNNNDALCCPLTPRRIVDVETKDEGEPEQFYDLKKSNTINSINNQTEHINEVDNDFVDDEEYDDGDNGLLVQFLDEANKIAEAKLAQRRQARVEAREIRMRELERQQKEQEQNADRVFDLHANSTGAGGDALSRTRLNAGMASLSINSVLNSTRANSMCSRRSSEDSLEEEGRSLRDIRHELKVNSY